MVILSRIVELLGVVRLWKRSGSRSVSLGRRPGVLVVTLLLLSSQGLADTQPKAIDPDRTAALVKRLVSPSFRVRLQAEADCRQTGSGVIPALVEALKSSDPELRLRAQELIERIEDDGHSETIKAFLAPGSTSGLPGWPIVADLVEDTPAIRSAYADILRDSTPLARALAHPHLVAGELQRQLQNFLPVQGMPRRGTGQPVASENTSAVMLLLIHPEGKIPLDGELQAARTIRQSVIQSASDTPSGQLLRAMVTRWVMTPGSGTAYDRLDTATRLTLPEALVPAIEMLDQRANPYQLNFAFAAIARYGSGAEMAVVEPLLQEKQELSAAMGANNQKTSTTQLRDLALATLIEMTKQDPTTYGLKASPRDGTNHVVTFVAAFPDDAQRDAAFEKWKVWSAANLRTFRPQPNNAIEGTSL